MITIKTGLHHTNASGLGEWGLLTSLNKIIGVIKQSYICLHRLTNVKSIVYCTKAAPSEARQLSLLGQNGTVGNRAARKAGECGIVTDIGIQIRSIKDLNTYKNKQTNSPELWPENNQVHIHISFVWKWSRALHLSGIRAFCSPHNTISGSMALGKWTLQFQEK